MDLLQVEEVDGEVWLEMEALPNQVVETEEAQEVETMVGVQTTQAAVVTHNLPVEEAIRQIHHRVEEVAIAMGEKVTRSRRRRRCRRRVWSTHPQKC